MCLISWEVRLDLFLKSIGIVNLLTTKFLNMGSRIQAKSILDDRLTEHGDHLSKNED